MNTSQKSVLVALCISVGAATGSRAVNAPDNPIGGTESSFVGQGQVRTAETPGPGLRVAVNGAERPDLVPDSLAYYHFIMATALSQSPSPDELARRSRELDGVGLSRLDSDALITALSNVREQLDEVEVARQALSPGTQDSSSTSELLKAREVSIFENAIARIRNVLSEDGQRRLEYRIREFVKRNIVIYGEPPQ
jgi:hypothetical protein